MAITIQDFVKAVEPNFAGEVTTSRDSTAWYKVIKGNTLVLPLINLIKCNPIIMQKTIESISSFNLKQKSPDVLYDWDNLNLTAIDFTCTDINDALSKIAFLRTQSLIACDIETKRIEWEDNCLLSIGFAYSETDCTALYNIPIGGAKCGLKPNPRVWTALQELFEDPNITWIWHNGKFDTSRLKYLCNLHARVDEDTMLQHYCFVNEKRGTHGLKDLGQLWVQAPDWDDELERIKKVFCRQSKIKVSDFTYDLIPLNVLVPYMQRDCIATYRLYKLFSSTANASQEFIYRMLIRASNTYKRIELNGFKINVDYLEALDYELENELISANKAFNTAVAQYWDPEVYVRETNAKSTPKEFNIKSPAQLKWLLTKVTGIRIENTSSGTIDDLILKAENGFFESSDVIQLLEALKSLRKANKYMDTYVTGLRDSLCADCRIRGSYNLHGTETGRLSSSNPNMQNIPRDKRIKNLFCAAPGNILLQVDYSQAELRVLALLSQDPWLIDVYKRGEDLHGAVATDMFGPGFTKEQRVMAKTINFGIAYGRGPGSIAQTFNKTMGEAVAIIEKWYKPMPKVKEWISNRRRMAMKGEECSTFLGRKRHFILTSENSNHVQNEYINTPIQSIASDFTMCSLLAIQDWLDATHLSNNAKIVATVHDSIILEVPDDKDIINGIAAKCTEIMSKVPKELIEKYGPHFDLTVPFVADVEVGYSWGDMHEIS